jgi:hypothetical protein
MTTSRNLSTSSKKPCEKGKMRTKVIQYRCITNKTFHDKVNKKLTNMRPRSSRKSSRRSSVKKNNTKPSFLNTIKGMGINNLRKASPRRSPPSFLNAIRSMNKQNLKHVSTNMNKKAAPSFLTDIKGMNKQKLKHVSSNKPLPKEEGILPTINSKYNEFRNKLALRQKILKQSSGSNNDDEWSS